MSKTNSEPEKKDKSKQPHSPLIIPVLPNDEVDPILPEPLEAPPDSEDQQPPTPIDENPDRPPIYV